MRNRPVVYLLRVVHGLAALYFLTCLIYLYYAVILDRMDTWLVVAVVSLAAEGIAVFLLNNGDCPLIHVQRKIGDDKPFFELFFLPKLAKQAIPIFGWIAGTGAVLLAVRLLFG